MVTGELAAPPNIRHPAFKLIYFVPDYTYMYMCRSISTCMRT